MSRFYKVTPSFDRLDEKDYRRISSETSWEDLWIDSSLFNDEVKAKMGRRMWGVTGELNEIKGLPDYLPMYGWLDLLEKTELPTNNIAWEIVSNRFIEAIRETGFNNFRLIPIRVIDRASFPNLDENLRLFEQNRNLVDINYRDDWFYGFQILEHIPLLAEDANPMERDFRLRNDVNSLKLPPIFQEQRTAQLFVSEIGKTALENAGIRGIRIVEPFGLL